VLVLKRLLDFVLATLLLFPAMVVCLFCILVIKLDSPGPGLFSQTRLGRNQKPFKLYKLRTMAVNTGNHASHEVPAGQITKAGLFLRRTKLDELPQIINVLIGDMSFVGPRPCLPSQSLLVQERQSRGVFQLRPGITGAAQVAGIDMSTPEKLAVADAHYLNGVSVLEDMRLMLATVSGAGRGDAAKTPRK